MTSNIIPKEKLTAFQRWELASFNDDVQADTLHLLPDPEPEPIPVPQFDPEEVARLNASYLAQLREEAQQEGYAQGFEQGQREGMASGRAAVEEQAAAVAQQVAALRSIALSFGRDLAQADDIVAQDMLGLALDLAKAMLKTALPAKPELVLPVVSEAIRYLPTVQQPALLFLHPEDAIVVNSHMQDELGKAGWRVAEDRHLERGGCRVETASNQIDATVAGRWQRIAAALGKTEGWLE